MEQAILYANTLIEITSQTILFRNYYFPYGKKQIAWSEIEHIEVTEPTILNGKFRIHGTGDFRTWFPRDRKRPTRDKIFIIYLRNKNRRIGFTVENSEKVVSIIKTKGPLASCWNFICHENQRIIPFRQAID
jgi:hypothetical protein